MTPGATAGEATRRVGDDATPPQSSLEALWDMRAGRHTVPCPIAGNETLYIQPRSLLHWPVQLAGTTGSNRSASPEIAYENVELPIVSMRSPMITHRSSSTWLPRSSCELKVPSAQNVCEWGVGGSASAHGRVGSQREGTTPSTLPATSSPASCRIELRMARLFVRAVTIA